MSKSREQLEVWIKKLDVKATKCLDVGGSQLNVLGRLGGSKFVEYKILDLEKPHEDSQAPDIALDLNKKYAMEEWAKYKGNFSIAFCLEVMEYCYNPLQALKNIAYFMKKDAKLHISFHFYYPIHKPHGTDMLRYTEFGAKKLLEEAGFDVHRVEMRVPNVESAALLESYDEIEGNKRDGEYSRHYTNGYLITAVKK